MQTPGRRHHRSLRDEIQQNLTRFQRRARRDRERRSAAVALALIADETGEACFALTRRTAKLRRHAGQWALPGGRLDPGEDAEGAARRELLEEVGIDLEGSPALGMLDDFPTRSGFVITPVVFWRAGVSTLHANPEEVARVYRVPLTELEKPDQPRIEPIRESEHPLISMRVQQNNIYAPTAAILFQLAEVALRGQTTRVDHFEQPIFAWK